MTWRPAGRALVSPPRPLAIPMDSPNLELCARFLLDCLAPELRAWLDEPAHLERQRDRLRKSLAERAPGTDRVARFAASCPVEGASVEDYALRSIRLRCGCDVLAGIHFYGMDRTRPFVGVEAQSRALSGEEALEAARELAERFAVFHPPLARFHGRQGGADFALLPGARPDTLVYAGRLATLLEAPPPAGLDRLALRDEDPVAYFAEYERDYAALHAERPELVGKLFRESLETLLRLRANGLCRRLYVDGAPAGVVASERGDFDGLEGWIVSEEILGAPFRGQRLGPCAQRLLARALVDELGADAGDLLLGTIDFANAASRRTAERSGRVAASSLVFLPTGAAAPPA